MNIHQRFHLKQSNHEITFYAYDIVEIHKITPSDLSAIFIAECANRDYAKGCANIGSTTACCNCPAPHFQDLWLDGWLVGDDHGFLNDNSYYAKLQTGIRVPVNREIYELWKEGWEKGPILVDNSVYELI